MKDNVKILIADDHPIVRNGLKQILQSDPIVNDIREAGDGEAALEILMSEPIDVAILDLAMPKVNGLDVVRKVLKKHVPTELIMMTMYKDETIFNRAMDLGVKGFVLKDNALVDILNCVKTVVQGGYYISPLISEYLVRRSGRSVATSKMLPGIDNLTEMERVILRLLAEMKTSKEIAAELSISPKTVENHRNNISRKLEIRGSHALLRFAVENRAQL